MKIRKCSHIAMDVDPKMCKINTNATNTNATKRNECNETSALKDECNEDERNETMHQTRMQRHNECHEQTNAPQNECNEINATNACDPV